MSTISYPRPNFSFSVTLAGKTLSFSEVSGLKLEVQAIEYRHGDSPDYHTFKQPGMRKQGNVTLKRGFLDNDSYAIDWFETLKMNIVDFRTITISLLDENQTALCKWSLSNAFILNIDGGPYKSTSNEITIETMELACDIINYSLS